MARFIFITGGVVSSLGKGLASAALGALLQARGYTVRLRKLDPYLNVDPGTMSPTQHGEVFVTDDGAETDLDLGHYERFTGRTRQPAGQHHHRPHLSGADRQERRGDFLCATVQVIRTSPRDQGLHPRRNDDYDPLWSRSAAPLATSTASLFEAIRSSATNCRAATPCSST